jgi:hypothetical protein
MTLHAIVGKSNTPSCAISPEVERAERDDIVRSVFFGEHQRTDSPFPAIAAGNRFEVGHKRFCPERCGGDERRHAETELVIRTIGIRCGGPPLIP